MPFVHNDHYHRLLLRQVPRDARTALDVGCGHGRFARRLENHGLEAIAAIDPVSVVIAQAQQASNGSRVSFRTADATTCDLDSYDYISCLASIHHMPFETVARLRDALNPGGVLAILGLYNEASTADWVISLAAVPVNAGARLTVYAADRVRGIGPQPNVPVRNPAMTYQQIREESSQLLPGRRIRHLLFWRYLLVYRKPMG